MQQRIAEGTVLFECSLQPRNKESRIGGIAADGTLPRMVTYIE